MLRGVCYDNPERPEILRQLPNETDIQNEQFWWDRPNGSCICASLLELRDKTGDMMSKEGDPDAYERVADQLGYDTVGVPASDEDDLQFSEYRQSGDLGLLSERRWEREIAWAKPKKESAICWFVANAGVEDEEVQPKFLSRSLATLRVQLILGCKLIGGRLPCRQAPAESRTPPKASPNSKPSPAISYKCSSKKRPAPVALLTYPGRPPFISQPRVRTPASPPARRSRLSTRAASRGTRRPSPSSRQTSRCGCTSAARASTT